MTTPVDRVRSPVARAILVIAGIACLASAGLAAVGVRRSAVSMSDHAGPSMAVSLAVAGILGLLDLAGFVSAAVHWSRTSPRIQADRCLLAAVVMLGLSALVINGEQATSFVSWQEARGLPLPWLNTGRYYGPCAGAREICRIVWLESVRPIPLLLDLTWLFLVSIPLLRLTARDEPDSRRDTPSIDGIAPASR